MAKFPLMWMNFYCLYCTFLIPTALRQEHPQIVACSHFLTSNTFSDIKAKICKVWLLEPTQLKRMVFLLSCRSKFWKYCTSSVINILLLLLSISSPAQKLICKLLQSHLWSSDQNICCLWEGFDTMRVDCIIHQIYNFKGEKTCLAK